MGSSWYFDETTDDPGQSSLDNISFNGQLVNAVGRMIYAGKLKDSHDRTILHHVQSKVYINLGKKATYKVYLV